MIRYNANDDCAAAISKHQEEQMNAFVPSQTDLAIRDFRSAVENMSSTAARLGTALNHAAMVSEGVRSAEVPVSALAPDPIKPSPALIHCLDLLETIQADWIKAPPYQKERIKTAIAAGRAELNPPKPHVKKR